MGFLSSSLAQLQRSKRNYLFCLQIQHWTLELTGKQFHLCVCACLCVCLSQILSGQAKNNPNENQTIGRIMNISVFIVPQIASCSCKSISSLVFQDTPCETVWIGISTPPFFFFQGSELRLKSIERIWPGLRSKALVCWPGNQISWFWIQPLLSHVWGSTLTDTT